MKINWHRISIETLYFKTCLPTRQDGFQNRDEVLIASIVLSSEYGFRPIQCRIFRDFFLIERFKKFSELAKI